MSETSFFVLTSDEDGLAVRVQGFTKAELEQWLNTRNPSGQPWVCTDTLPKQDKGHHFVWPEGAMLIIEGRIVLPKAVETVTRWELPEEGQ